MTLDPIPICPQVLRPIVVGWFRDPPSWIVCAAVVALLSAVGTCAWCVRCCKKRSLKKEKEKDAAAASAMASAPPSVSVGGGGSNIPFVYGMGGPSLKDFQAQVSTVVRLQNAKRNAELGAAGKNLDSVDGGRVETVKNDPRQQNGSVVNQLENDAAFAAKGQPLSQHSTQQKQRDPQESPLIPQQRLMPQHQQSMPQSMPQYQSFNNSTSATPNLYVSSPSQAKDVDGNVTSTADPITYGDGGRIDDQPASAVRKNGVNDGGVTRTTTQQQSSENAPTLTRFGRRPPPAPPFEKPPRVGPRGRGSHRSNTLGGPVSIAQQQQQQQSHRQVTFKTQSLSSEGRQ